MLVITLMGGCAVVPQYALHQEKYFPEGLDELYLGMPGKFLAKTRKNNPWELVSDDTDSTRVVYRETHSGQTFNEVLYFTDVNSDQLLYEIQVNYPEGTDPWQEAVKLYGESNAEEGEWFFETEEEFNLVIWVSDHSITISAREIRNN